jgi:hypothetical protein
VLLSGAAEFVEEGAGANDTVLSLVRPATAVTVMITGVRPVSDDLYTLLYRKRFGNTPNVILQAANTLYRCGRLQVHSSAQGFIFAFRNGDLFSLALKQGVARGFC